MAKHHKPRAGSRAFWPKKRAARIYPRLRSGPGKDVKPLGFAAYKAGMLTVNMVDTKKGSATQGQEVIRGATVLDCPALVVCGVKAYKKTAYGRKDLGTAWTEKISKDLERKTRTPKKKGKKIEDLERLGPTEVRLLVHTKPREAGVRKKTPELFEIPIGGEDVKKKLEYARQKLGSELKVEEVFSDGDWIDVSAVTKGKGFQGPVKRFGVKVRSRKNEKKRRHVGTLGPVTPARVLPAKLAMPGQLGFQSRTEYNKRALKVGTGGIAPKGGFLSYGNVPGSFLIMEGSLPGPRKRMVMLRPGIRAKPREQIQLKEVLLESPQGV